MARWSPRQVSDAAPDASSLTAARRLATPGPWRETGCNEVLVWGQCQGSGKTPYQVSVDVVAPAYRCSCPSRKFPCKHALALLMLWAEGVLEDSGQMAGFAREWADQRAERASGGPARHGGDTAPDPEAQAKRLAERTARMDAGVADLRVWMGDLVRGGLAAARTQPTSWWDQAAARLVDAQLPALADRVREAGSQVHARPDWADHLLTELGRWWVITSAWQRREALDPVEQADLRVAVGWSQASSEVREVDQRPGPWTVLGAHRSDDGRLQQQRTWLRHDDGELVVVLDFAGYGQSLATPQLSGARLDVTVARYPGSAPRRGMFVDLPTASGSVATLTGGTTLAAATEDAARSLETAPWRSRHPAALAGVTLGRPSAGSGTSSRSPGTPGGSDWLVVDATGSVPMTADADPWLLLAVSGAHEVDVFGELDGGAFRPLSLWTGDAVVAL
ncbi:MAG: FIG01127675: hypothetical protein [uncultured Nocardioides sp.]|uniref:SWIM-type domain-containing protein n=1 Tax=uncultured Nocardioides sp. TaxID=198441 RepID=A0A6J4P756_9ACTN|nr:MAG: FIG01127675: hypothetical protein [uncultured Nocardioides sp.]